MFGSFFYGRPDIVMIGYNDNFFFGLFNTVTSGLHCNAGSVFDLHLEMSLVGTNTSCITCFKAILHCLHVL